MTTSMLSIQSNVKEVRGIGLQISRLESVDISRRGYKDNGIELWLSSSLAEARKRCGQINGSDKQSNSGDLSVPNEEPLSRYTDNSNQPHKKELVLFYSGTGCARPSDNNAGYVRSSEMGASAWPPLHDLDVDVIKNLPTEIVLEMDNIYKGELSDFIRKREKKNTSVTLPNENIKVSDVCISSGYVASIDPDLGSNDKGKLPICEPLERTCFKVQPTYNSCSSSHGLYSTSTIRPSMPASLSQVDASVLEQLPEDVKADICCLLPAHRVSTCKGSPSGIDFPLSGESGNPRYSDISLWLGSPPRWVEKFKISGNIFLNTIATSYGKSGKDVLLSSILQSVAPLLSSVSESSRQVCNDALHSLHELLVQYIDIKIESDIEELYGCFCVLKRFSSVSKLLLQTYNSTLPHFQASLSENYGGKLRLSVIHVDPIEE
ncbi:DNA repair protein REV1 isoform X3 [Canna indica]|uniref:DNA repair protein REV1 isoform X3 n=1 Tax=Canna indica TaxID=4628 RepID=A0AAQ3KAL9_9LILI|nr:DNA repair protein REV1 isoform X3 [Canna indica]